MSRRMRLRQRVPAMAELTSALSSPANGSSGGLFAGDAASESRAEPPSPTGLMSGRPGNPGAPAPISVKDALIALQDALGDPVLWPDVRLTTLALDSELTTRTQRLLLAAMVYELADAFAKATS